MVYICGLSWWLLFLLCPKILGVSACAKAKSTKNKHKKQGINDDIQEFFVLLPLSLCVNGP